MRILLVVLLILAALWDSSGSSQAFGTASIPLFSLTILLSAFLLNSLDTIFIPLLAAGITLDLYGGMPAGSITLALLLAFIGGELLRSRWLSGVAPAIRFLLSISIFLLFDLWLLVLQLFELHRIAVSSNPFALLIAACLGSVVAVLLSQVFSPHRGQLSVKGLE